MNTANTRLCIAAVLLFFVPAIFAKDSLPPPNSNPQSRLPYEIIVTPNVTLNDLEKLRVQIEDDFFDKFNELNEDDKYDVRCYEFAPTGSHIKQRVCEPNFFIHAQGDNAADFLSALVRGVPPPMLLDRKDLRFDTKQEFEILQNKLEEMYRFDLEFNSIGNALADVKNQIKNFSSSNKD